MCSNWFCATLKSLSLMSSPDHPPIMGPAHERKGEKVQYLPNPPPILSGRNRSWFSPKSQLHCLLKWLERASFQILNHWGFLWHQAMSRMSAGIPRLACKITAAFRSLPFWFLCGLSQWSSWGQRTFWKCCQAIAPDTRIGGLENTSNPPHSHGWITHNQKQVCICNHLGRPGASFARNNLQHWNLKVDNELEGRELAFFFPGPTESIYMGGGIVRWFSENEAYGCLQFTGHVGHVIVL